MTVSAASRPLGAVLRTLDILGPAPRSNWTARPLPGNDFETRYGEDLALLAHVGIGSIRIGLDWSRLQPVPGRIDDNWREWYESVFLAAQRCGIAVWVALHEDTVPAWFDDEGSFADSRSASLAWPRWVETAAELFGDRVAGWFPIVDPVGAGARWSTDSRKHEVALVNMATAWRDSWRILRGGAPIATALAVRMVRPVDPTMPALEAARLEDHLRWKLWLRALRDGVVRLPNGAEHLIPELGASLDLLGIVTTLDVPEGSISDETLRRWEERLGTILRRVGEDGPDRPIVVAGLEARWNHPDERRLFVDSTVRSLQEALHDGVPLQSVFVDPAIGPVTGARDTDVASIVDRDRNTSDDAASWLALTLRTSGSDRGDQHGPVSANPR